MIPETLPKGTTREQWEQYEDDLQNFNTILDNRQSLIDDVLKAVAEFGIDKTRKIYTEAISRTRSMDAPNKPGYYRANND